MPLSNIPLGTNVHCVEMKPGKGAQIARSAGTSARVVAKEGIYTTLRLQSGEMRKILSECTQKESFSFHLTAASGLYRYLLLLLLLQRFQPILQFELLFLASSQHNEHLYQEVCCLKACYYLERFQFFQMMKLKLQSLILMAQ